MIFRFTAAQKKYITIKIAASKNLKL